MSERSMFRASPEQIAAFERARVSPDPYRSHLELKLTAPLSTAELARRVAALVAREEILRTELAPLPGLGEPVQQILAPEEISEPVGLRVWLARDDGRWLSLAAPSSQCDGPSLRAIAAELLAGLQPSEPGLQHADFAEWKHELLEAVPPSAAVEHFRDRALDPPLRLALETDAEPSAAFQLASTAEVALSGATAAAFARLAGAHGCSEPAVGLTLYAAVLARLGDRDEVSLGYDDGARGAVPATAIGPYSVSLPLRVALERGGPFARAVRSVERACEEARAHRDGFDASIEAAYAFCALPELAIDGAEAVREHSVSSRFKLRLTLRRQPGGSLCYRLDYDRAYLSENAVAAFEEQWLALLAAVAQDPSQPLATFDLLGPLQRACLAPEPSPAIEPVTVLELVERNAQARGDAAAVVDASGSITYRALDARANRLARVLRARGVGPSDVVALLVPRIKEAIVAILATHKLGAAYLPLDPEYPPERLRFMLADSGARLCVCAGEPAKVCAGLETVRVDLDLAPDDADAFSAPLETPRDLDALAYLIYTSGSTGTPKGVAITQHGLTHSTQVRISYYREPVRAYLLLSSFAFDSSVAGIFWTLATGGTLILPCARDVLEPSALARTCARHSVSHGLSLPSVYDALLDQPELAGARSLETWIVAGEACAPSVIDKHRARLPHVRLVNEYGPTEATVWATADDVTHGGAPGSIGRPIPGTRLALLNAQGTPSALGEPGEIVLGGPSLARGYHRRPELTAERFVVHPRLGTRVYRTGDRACFDAAGRVLFLGRIDRQVKIRGQRVELGEIERCLAADSRVREAVAVVTSEAPAQLLAFVRSDCPASELAPALEARLRAALPAAMHPQRIDVSAELPRTPNGKVDVAALLRRPERASVVFEPPQGEVESVLCEVCAELLRLPRVSATSNFFELGGDSISSLQLCARAAQRGVAFAVRDVFEHKVLREIARVAERREQPLEREHALVHEEVLSPEDAALLDDAPAQLRVQPGELLAALLSGAVPIASLAVEQRYAARGGGDAQSYCTVHALAPADPDWGVHLRNVRAALQATSDRAGADAWLVIDEPAGVAGPARCAAPLRLAIAPLESGLRARWSADAALYTPELLHEHARAFRERLEQLRAHCAADRAAELDAADFPSSGLDAQSLAALLSTLDR